MSSLYTLLKQAGCVLDHHYSDLYVKMDSASRDILLACLDREPSVFTSEIDGALWYDIPFAYDPYWEDRATSVKPLQGRHTPGVTRFSEEHGDITLSPVGIVRGRESVCRVHYNCHVPREESVANGRLLSAARNSYDKHCGPLAVECAEADLLGEALTLIRMSITAWNEAAEISAGNSDVTSNEYARKMADHVHRPMIDLLAKASVKEATNDCG